MFECLDTPSQLLYVYNVYVFSLMEILFVSNIAAQ